MKLTSKNVETVFFDCLFREEEVQNKDIETLEGCVKAQGLQSSFGFHSGRLKKHENEIYAMLKQLPSKFFEEVGDGWSFLNACNDCEGDQWTGLHSIMEQLVCLGIAIGKAEYCHPRELWKDLPGGMPYFKVLL